MQFTIRKFHLIGIGLGLITLAIGWWMQVDDRPMTWYTTAFYPKVRWVLDFSFGYLAFPPIYMLVVGLVSYISYKIYKSRPFRENWWRVMLLHIWAFVGYIYFAFYWLWGYNYNRPTIKTMLNIQPIAVDSTYLYQRALSLVGELNEIQPHVDYDYYTKPLGIEADIRKEVLRILNRYHLPAVGQPRVRLIAKSSLLRFGTAGIYIPFVGEGHVDAGVNPILHPSTMAHELTHGLGYGDEGECNLVAILALTQSNNIHLQYSGKILYLRYLTSDLFVQHPSLYQYVFDTYSEALRRDLIAIRDAYNYYPEIFPWLRDWIYDFYLKRNGVTAGNKSYSQVVNILRTLEQSPE